MPFGGQVGDIAVPMEQVECRIILPQQIVFDDGGPDQVVAAQQIKRQRKEPPVEIPVRRRHRLNHFELAIVDEIEKFAATGEIDLRSEERRRVHLRFFTLGV